EVELSERITDGLRLLLPPRTRAEAASLARIGTPLLRQLPQDPAPLTEAAASATVWAAALVNGPDALAVLRRFATDPRHRVQEALLDAWKYFNPEEYAHRVLENAPLLDGEVMVEDPAMLPALRHLTRLTSTAVILHHGTGLAVLDEVPHLTSVCVIAKADSIAALESHPKLEQVDLYYDMHFDPAPLTRLPALRKLALVPRADGNLDFLPDCRHLTELTVHLEDHNGQLLKLWELSGLTELTLRGTRSDTDLRGMSALAKLRQLTLAGQGDETSDTSAAEFIPLPERMPNITDLSLWNYDL
ncbi:MAG: hypothetical protein ACRD0P_19200, partial [Stackebrandtia sp.]